jgi:hypothetical protein
MVYRILEEHNVSIFRTEEQEDPGKSGTHVRRVTVVLGAMSEQVREREE